MRLAALVILSSVACSVSVAQDPELESFRTTTFLDADEDTIHVFQAACPPFQSSSCPYNHPVFESRCDVISFDSLGSVGEQEYLLARYKRSTVYAPSPERDEEKWTCEADEILLLQTRPRQYAKPVWFGTAERDYEFITAATLVNSPKADFFSVTYCLNGTGGCQERILIWLDEAWHILERDSTWEQVYAQLPRGYRLHKSPPIDLERLTWEQHVAGPHDANCCPSGRLFLELDVIDNRLSITKAKLEVDLFLNRE